MRLSLARIILYMVLSINIFFSSLFISWQCAKYSDYYYSLLYKPLNIEQHIKKYAPYNKQKKDFDRIGEQEHKRVFSEIVQYIHGFGIGLRDLGYYSQDGERVDSVLTQTEVAHLQEVAHVITLFSVFGVINLLVSIIIVCLSFSSKLNWPGVKQIFAVWGCFLFALGVVFLIFGFNRIFYNFHELLFSDAPWVFSYRDSLLIVLTKSPQYFAVVGLAILFPACVLFAFIIFCLCHFKVFNNRLD